MTTDTLATLPSALSEAMESVEVDADLRRVMVGDREVAADDRKQLHALLTATLYDVWHAGRNKREGPQQKSLRDPAFERTLRDAVPHDTTVVTGKLVDPEAPADDEVLVWLSRVRVRVPAQQVAAAPDGAGDQWVQVRIPSVLPAISPGFLMVNGSRGTGLPASATLRLYFHIGTPEAAPVVWGAVLSQMESDQVRYRAKVTSVRSLFPRRDALVVYLGDEAWPAVPDIQRAATASGGIAEGVSSYVSRLSDGVGWAWDPIDSRPGMRGMSFGEHRSHAIATGILDAGRDGDRHATVAEALRAAGIRADAIHRNADSPDLPYLVMSETRVRGGEME